MKSEERIIELLVEMVEGQDQSNKRLDQTINRLDQTINRLDQTNEKLDGLEKQVQKLNIQTSENTRAIMKLADKMDDFAEHEKRIQKLEKVVLKRG